MSKFIVSLLALFSLVGCAGQVLDEQPAPGTFGALCGFHEGVDRGQCGTGLECFGVCTFECGERYHQIADGSYEYGLDQASVDECAAHGGACIEHSTDVHINVCKTPHDLPAGCSVQPESVRKQSCYYERVAIACGASQPNPDPSRCAVREGQQEAGIWCCQSDPSVAQ